MKNRSKIISLFFLILLIFFLFENKLLWAKCWPISWAYQLQNINFNKLISSHFSLLVIDYSRDGSPEKAFKRKEIRKLQKSGKKVLAYISIGEAENYRFYWKKRWDSHPPFWLGNENKKWKGNYPVKYWNYRWKKIIFSYLDKIISQGFDGIYLDRVDVFEYWSNIKNGEKLFLREKVAAQRMIIFIKEIVDYCRFRKGEDFMVIPQNGERLLIYDKDGILVKFVSGWSCEEMIFNDGKIKLREFKERMEYLKPILHRQNKILLSVDYVDDGSGFKGRNKLQIYQYLVIAFKNGFSPYVARSDALLNNLNIIPFVQP